MTRDPLYLLLAFEAVQFVLVAGWSWNAWARVR